MGWSEEVPPLGGTVHATSPWGLRNHVRPLLCPHCALTFFMEAQGPGARAHGGQEKRSAEPWALLPQTPVVLLCLRARCFGAGRWHCSVPSLALTDLGGGW